MASHSLYSWPVRSQCSLPVEPPQITQQFNSFSICGAGRWCCIDTGASAGLGEGVKHSEYTSKWTLPLSRADPSLRFRWDCGCRWHYNKTWCTSNLPIYWACALNEVKLRGERVNTHLFSAAEAVEVGEKAWALNTTEEQNTIRVTTKWVTVAARYTNLTMNTFCKQM